METDYFTIDAVMDSALFAYIYYLEKDLEDSHGRGHERKCKLHLFECLHCRDSCVIVSLVTAKTVDILR